MAPQSSAIPVTRSVVVITDDYANIYNVTATRVKLVNSVSWGKSDFVGEVARTISEQCGNKSVLILNDMVEQYYRKEKLPNVGLLDKPSILKRKLHVAFPDSPIRAALSLSGKGPKTKSGDKSDSYLFAAVPRSEEVETAIRGVRQSYAQISAFCLLPVESADMVWALSGRLSKDRGDDKRPSWTVFMGQHQGGGLRQIVVRDGQLALTRLTPIVDTDIEPGMWAAEVAQEFRATMSYIKRFGYSPQDGLDVILIAGHAAGEGVAGMIDEDCYFTYLNAHEAASLLKIKIGSQEENRLADPLHVAWSGRKLAFTMPMRSDELNRLIVSRKAALAAMTAATFAFLYLGYLVSTQYLEMYKTEQTIQAYQEKQAEAQRLYRQEVERKESQNLPINLIRGAIKVSSQVREQGFDPLPLVLKVGNTLDPDIHIDKMTMTMNQREKPTSANTRDAYNARQDQPQKQNIFNARLFLSFPGNIDLIAGNERMRNLVSRLRDALPDYEVRLSKKLANLSVTGAISDESGLTAQPKSEREGYTAEIDLEKVLNARNSGS